jgi:hypothetical protein
MRALTASEAKKWCRANGAQLGDSGFPEARRRATSFEIPTDAGRRVALVARHLEEFRGRGQSLVWFNDWSVWPSGQRMHIFERLRASYGETRPLAEVPAFLFNADEYEGFGSFVTLGVLFLWDVHVVGAHGQLLFYSHDELGWIAS